MTFYWKTLTLDEYANLSLDDYNLLELEEEAIIMAADIVAIDSGNDYYVNGNYILNYGAKSTFENQWDAANSGLYNSISSGLISDISGLYESRFDDVGFYVTGGA